MIVVVIFTLIKRNAGIEKIGNYLVKFADILLIFLHFFWEFTADFTVADMLQS